MASVYKRFRRGRESRKYFVAYVDEHGQRRETVGTTDKTTSERIAAKLEAEAELRRRGIIDPREERIAEQGRQPVEQHLDGYEVYLEGKGDTAKHVAATRSWIDEVLDACGTETLSALDASKIVAYLGDLRRGGAGRCATNARITALRGFSRWLWRTDRLSNDPLKVLSKVNAQVDKRHRRRALTEEEIGWLLRAAETGQPYTWRTQRGRYAPTRMVSGSDRAMLYRLCLETGLRASEAASLTPGSLHLADSDNATLVVEAGYSKHRREDVLPLRRDLAEALAAYVCGRGARDRLWTMPPKPAAMLREDLRVAGVPYRDASRRFADFHALRHTFITRLVRSGVAPAVARNLARHSTITLTLDYYTHVFAGDERGAMERLPSLDIRKSFDARVG